MDIAKNIMRYFNVLFTVLLACLFLIGGCDSKPTYDSLMKENINLLREYLAVSKTITDESSARAAYPKVVKINNDMDRIKADMDKLGKPNKEIEAQLAAKYKEELDPLLEEYIHEILRFEMDPKLKAIDSKLKKEFEEKKNK